MVLWSTERASTRTDCGVARRRLDNPFLSLGLRKNTNEGDWFLAKKLDHIGVYIDKEEMKVHVIESKIVRIRRMVKEILLLAHGHQRLLALGLITSVCIPYAGIASSNILHNFLLLRSETRRTEGKDGI